MQFFEHVLHEYVYLWYGDVSLDQEFLQELRTSLRFASSVILRRLSSTDLTQLITVKAIPVGLSHLDNYTLAKSYSEAFSVETRDCYFDLLGQNSHPAARNREKEIHYVQNVVKKLLPILSPPRTLKSGSVRVMLEDVVSGAVFQPLMDLLADPDIINFIVQTAFAKDPSKKFAPLSDENVEFLRNFVDAHKFQSRSALHMDLSAILKNQQSLFAFMQFLKEEGAINQLQFCLSVGKVKETIINRIKLQNFSCFRGL